MDFGYARVSTTAQDLTRQIDTIKAAGIPEELIWSDRRTGATMARDGLEDLLRRVPPHAGHWITVAGRKPGADDARPRGLGRQAILSSAEILSAETRTSSVG
ncbi:recombinase family protein [Nonomuraea sp. NPDC050153]|uniref:recombinase family protein n=1 Tax=Nonomuraea sp. NPDC050153 TaxID=3364359 RepID=UPI0037BC6941